MNQILHATQAEVEVQQRQLKRHRAYDAEGRQREFEALQASMDAKYELALQEKLVAAEQRYHKLYEEKLEIEVLKGRRDLELQLDAARTRAEKAEDVVTFHAQRAAQEKTLSDARARQWSDERAKLTRDAEASYDSLYKEVSTNANDVVEKLQAQLRAAQAAAEEARAFPTQFD